MFEKMEATRRKKQQQLPSESGSHDNEEISTPLQGTPKGRERWVWLLKLKKNTNNNNNNNNNNNKVHISVCGPYLDTVG